MVFYTILDNDGGDDNQTLLDVNFHAVDDSFDSPCVVRIKESDRKITNNFDKFRLLMWKNFLLQYRHKVQTFIQILIPILFTTILVFVRSLIEPEVNAQNTTFHSFEIDQFRPL